VIVVSGYHRNTEAEPGPVADPAVNPNFPTVRFENVATGIKADISLTFITSNYIFNLGEAVKDFFL
jgi:hypothetical protein